MLYILENAEAEVQYPDIKFWEHVSEPVLARDAFSSLMWTFFCLPRPFLSCKESYLSLVHAFYVVNVTKVKKKKKKKFSVFWILMQLYYSDVLTILSFATGHNY